VLGPGRLVIATHNRGKLAEIAPLLGPHGIEPVAAIDLGLAVPDETDSSFAGNALLTARAAAMATGLPALSDDSGLSVDALGGAPGVHTADWAETPSGRDWDLAMQRVEDALAALGPATPRTASFHCVLALAWPDGRAETFEGIVSGTLAWPPRGQKGFGFDPVFVPDGETRTFAEMAPAEKQARSHRTRAFERLRGALLR
jgi:XTP/dITP diphosphohydrolase